VKTRSSRDTVVTSLLALSIAEGPECKRRARTVSSFQQACTSDPSKRNLLHLGKHNFRICGRPLTTLPRAENVELSFLQPLSRDKLVQLLVRLGWKKEQLGKGGVNVLGQSGPPRKATAAG
jgi:hypothetical protein